MSVIHGGPFHRLALRRATEREVERRVARWRRKKVWKAPLLWVVAGVVALLGWLGRTK